MTVYEVWYKPSGAWIATFLDKDLAASIFHDEDYHEFKEVQWSDGSLGAPPAGAREDSCGKEAE